MKAKKQHVIIFTLAIVIVAAIAIIITNINRPVNSAADMLSLGERYLLEMEFEQALVQFLGVIAIDPMNVHAYLGASEAYIGLGEADNAIEILRQGLEQTGSEDIAWAWVNLDPENTQAYLDVAAMLIATGNLAVAIEKLLAGLERTGSDVISRRLDELAELAESQNPDDAIDDRLPTSNTLLWLGANAPPGLGTEDSPFLLSAPEHLEWLENIGIEFFIDLMNDSYYEVYWVNWLRGMHFRVTANITAPDNMEIELPNPQGGHVFDGGGYTIYINSHIEYDGSAGGVFRALSGDDIVKNLNIAGSISAESAQYLGGLTGTNWGLIENVHSSIALLSNSASIGGIAGINGAGDGQGSWPGISTIRNSLFSGSIDSSGGMNGGIAARNNGGSIVNCLNVGSVRGHYAGGIAGWNTADGEIIGSQSSGSLDGFMLQGEIAAENAGTIND